MTIDDGMSISLQEYGLKPLFMQQLSTEEIEQGRVARVLEVHRTQLKLFDETGERSVQLGLSWSKVAPENRPTVGDWVVLERGSTGIERILERKSVFQRVAAGDNADIQLIAANIDVLFIVTSCNEEFKESRLERYLALATEAGVMPVVVFTKADLSEDSNVYLERVRSILPDIPVEFVNALDSCTFTGVNAWIERGSTIALVGSSGVGKSTLLNSLAGESVAATGSIREDDKKGRHTTSHRALYRLPNGGLVIDVPGIRELKIAGVDEALAEVFEDIESISSHCRFKDCLHESEPECAVQNAIANGELDERRLQNYQKLLSENKRNTATLAEKRLQDRTFSKHVRQVKALKQNKGVQS